LYEHFTPYPLDGSVILLDDPCGSVGAKHSVTAARHANFACVVNGASADFGIVIAGFTATSYAKFIPGSYSYVDLTSRLSGVTYPTSTGLSTSYTYFGNTSTDSNPGDGDQRLKTIQNFTSSGSTSLSKFDYTYNPVGTIATWTQQADSSTAVVNTLTYDNADQLTGAVQSGGDRLHQLRRPGPGDGHLHQQREFGGDLRFARAHHRGEQRPTATRASRRDSLRWVIRTARARPTPTRPAARRIIG
jgi:hypothetical protein